MNNSNAVGTVGAIFAYFILLNSFTLGLAFILGEASVLSKIICSNGILLWVMAVLPCVSNGLRWWLGILVGLVLSGVWSICFGYIVSQIFGDSILVSDMPESIGLASAYVAVSALIAWLLTRTFIHSTFSVLRAGG